MNTKKQFFIVVIIVVVIYIIGGYLIVIRPQINEQDGSSELQNTEGQEFYIAIGDQDEESEIKRQGIYNEIKENVMGSEELVTEIETSISYISENLTELNEEDLFGLELESNVYLDLYYHSSFLFGFSDNHDGQRTSWDSSIEKHEIITWASSIRNYLIECEEARELDENRIKELTEESNLLKNNSVSELADMIIQTNSAE